DLAHALGLVVVAEGVETGDQVTHLRRLGCDLAQGYFFARPQPAVDLERLLDAGALTARTGPA
ncbi:MAG TPA: EAL domain-containing protein, partial [Acidimicrobiia bacterium]|nr:EAL domain-containing protein [Acidimicrobiia bacterium]